MKHIDSHIHLYPESLMNAIYRYFDKLGWQLPLRPNVKEALAHLKANDVEKAFLLLYAHKTGMSWELNRWAHELCQEHPMLLPFGCYFPEDSHNATMVKTCLHDWQFAGFKLHFNVQKFRPDDARYFPVYRGALEYGGGLVMHIGTFPDKGEHLGASRLLSVMKQFPGLSVVVAHMGFYDTEDFWRIMDRFPGVYLDTSFILGNPDFAYAGEVVYETLKRFPERVLYGSDFPLICHRLEDGLDSITKLPWGEEHLNNLLYRNALNFLSRTQAKGSTESGRKISYRL